MRKYKMANSDQQQAWSDVGNGKASPANPSTDYQTARKQAENQNK